MADEDIAAARRELVRQALITIDDLRSRLKTAESARREPIAVVGIGCRYPGGVTDPDSFWKLLCNGVDAVTEVPPGRWDNSQWYDPNPESPGKTSTRWGGFLDSIDTFDAEFFGIPPREAAIMDPQHRMVLEVAWEALENSGRPFANLAGSQTGIFVGVTNNEYYQHLLRILDPAALSPYLATGNVLNAAAGRLAYFLDTHGPSLTIDTACSSSLTAVHLACQSLRAGECETALAGGVNAIVVPETSVIFTKWGMMAADGRCKAFDEAADGFVRSEGCGILVLRRLADALTAGDRILAVIEGSAVNQDGRSSGLTVPNGLAQQAVIRQALANAGIEANQIDYVEAHGTGTLLGDPIEVETLAAVFGPGRDWNHKLRIGSVKTNLGHTESASGVAGLIKCVLALQHEQLPAQLHLRHPSSHIAWQQMALEVITQPALWPRGPAARRAGVSSFGFSGANAHAIVAEAPVLPTVSEALIRPRQILAFSARDPNALTDLASRYESALRQPNAEPLADFCFTANTGRAPFRYRAAFSGESSERLADALRGFSNRGSGKSNQKPGRVAFVFSGEGPQYGGMGQQLYDSQPIFRAELERCAKILTGVLDRPLLEILFALADRSKEMDRPSYAQPCLFAVGWSLAQLWRAWGVEPAAVFGYGAGEYVAACFSSVMSLEDGLRLIAARGRLAESRSRQGLMARVGTDEETVRRLLMRYPATVAIVAVDGPRSIVICGESDTVGMIHEELRREGIPIALLPGSHSFYSPLMELEFDSFQKIATQVKYGHAQIPIATNLTGALAKQDEVASAAYWRRQAQNPIRFHDGLQELYRQGCRLFVEIGPESVLADLGRESLGESDHVWLPSLIKGRNAWETLLQSLGDLYLHGVDVDWAGFDRGYTRRRVAVPTYPFQRKRFWVDNNSISEQPEERPMLQWAPASPLIKEILYSGELSIRSQPWLADHVVGGQTIVPMTAYVGMVLSAAVESLQMKCVTIEDLIVSERLIITTDKPSAVQLVLSPDETQDSWTFRIVSLDALQSKGWLLHASGRVRRLLDTAPPLEAQLEPQLERPNARLDGAAEIDGDEHYRIFAGQGIDFGPAFRGVRRVTAGAREAAGEILNPVSATALDSVFHPALLDACLQPMIHAWPSRSGSAPVLPLAVERIDVWGGPTAVMTSYCRARASTGETLVGDATLRAESGRVVMEVRGLTGRRFRERAENSIDPWVEQWLYEIKWRSFHPQDTSGGEGMPAPEVAIAAARRNHSRHLQHAADSGFHEAARLLEARSLELIKAAFDALGWKPDSGERVRLQSFAHRFGVQERYARLLARLLDILTHAGWCEAAGEDWVVTRPFTPIARFDGPANRNSCEDELTLLEHCGARLADVLRGQCDPLDLLFGPAAAELLERIYSGSLTATTMNRLTADVFRGLADRSAAGSRMRVLEIGAGTGGTTAHVLNQLPGTNLEYWFTDVSPALLVRARSRFREYSVLRYELLDIERELESQGFAGQEFDVILAANVLHAMADLRRVLSRVHQLLRPAGLLVLVEGTSPQSWIDLTFGLTDGWWKFTDIDLRAKYPLLARSEWLRLLEAEGFSKPLDLSGLASSGSSADYTLFVAARSAEPQHKAPNRDAWIVLLDDHGTADGVVAELRQRGQNCFTVQPDSAFQHRAAHEFGVDPTMRGDYDRLLETLQQSRVQIHGIVHAWSLNINLPGSAAAQEFIQAQDWSSRSLLYLAQSLASRGHALEGGLWVLTRGAQAVAGERECTSPGQAPVWGLGKVLAQEHPELRVARFDLDPTARVASEARRIADHLLRPWHEAQWALRGDLVNVPRLVQKKAVTIERPARLVATDPGRLETLDWKLVDRRAPGPGEIEIRVEAVGLNFRDVLNALGMYPGDEVPLGGEVAGVVVSVGPGVTELLPGDSVACLAPGGFSDYVVTAAGLAIGKPTKWSFAEIVTVPAAFATAYHALIQVGRIRPGLKVLIHTAAGAVGLAAVRLAQQAGCEIAATAGSSKKRDYLRSLGVKHVFDSRSVTFADGVRKAFGEVDLVLNTLSGEFIEASLSLLSQRGHFVELGKRGIWNPSQVASMRPEANYSVIDLAAMIEHSPSELSPILAAANAAVAAGTFGPLPLEQFPRGQVVEAFRHMAQAKHIGKIVVEMGSPNNRLDVERFQADNHASYLITGGLTGLGLLTAEWLVSRGARHLALVARSEPGAPAKKVLEALSAAGANIVVCQGDVSVAADVAQVLHKMRTTLPPIRGVIHAAGVLDDGAILSQEWPRFERVLSPKVAGAWNLHLATLDLPLDFFICYSSASVILGSLGQSNHAAANAFLDALAHYRRGLGLPALSVNWGAWSGAGAAASREVFDRVADYGVTAINPAAGFAALEQLIAEGSAQAAVVPMNWVRFLSRELPVAERSFFEELETTSAPRKVPRFKNGPLPPESQFGSMSPVGRKQIQSSIRDAIIGVLGLDPQIQLDPLQALRDLGFDSLTSIELRNRLQAVMCRPLPATLVFDFPSFSALVDHLCEGSEAPLVSEQNLTEPAISPTLKWNTALVSRLSPADAEKVLAEELARTRRPLY